VPVDMAVKEPGTRVICRESEGHIVRRATDTHYITTDRVLVVVSIAAGDSDDVEVMPMEMHRVRECTGERDLHGLVRRQGV